MARQYLPRANLIQGGTVPVSAPGVSLPMQNPALQQEAAFYNTLSERLDQFSTLAFKKAGEKAEAAGLQFGANNAPTLEQIELAKKTGQPVEVDVGDPGGNIFEKAAYKGSMAVVEDNFSIAARRSLTEVFAKATQDPNMTPSELTAKLDTTINEYSLAMKNISGSSSAKVRASLGIVANSQVTQFSREYIRKAEVQARQDALEGVGTITQDAKTIIKGHQTKNDTNLIDKLGAMETTIRNNLEKVPGISESKILQKLKAHRKEVSAAKVGVISDWASTGKYAGAPHKALIELQKFRGNKMSQFPDYLRDIWGTMDTTEQQAATASILKTANSLRMATEMESKKDDDVNDKIKITQTRKFYDSFKANDIPGMRQTIEALKPIDPELANDFEGILQSRSGVLSDNQEELARLNQLLGVRALTYKDITNAEGITNDTKAELFGKLPAQRDKKVEDGRVRIAAKIGLTEQDLNQPPTMLKKEKQKTRVLYDRAYNKLLNAKIDYENKAEKTIREGKIPEPFDSEKIVEELLEQLEIDQKAAQIQFLKDSVEDVYILFMHDEEESMEGLKDAIKSKKYDAMRVGRFQQAIIKLRKLQRLQDQ